VSSRLPEDEALPRVWVDAWRSDVADATRIRGAYRRFLRENGPMPGRTPWLLVARWVLLGVAIGMGSVYAATGPLHLLGSEPAHTEPASPQKTAPARATRREPTNVVAAPLTQPDEAEPRSDVASPSAAPVASTSEQWQRAARGLRDRDFATAQAALEELAHHGSVSERESARLVQAQLLVSQGHTEEAAGILRELQGSAQSSAVRSKARELLSHLVENRPSQRSFAPLEGTNTP
jgi:hypothetical protein